MQSPIYEISDLQSPDAMLSVLLFEVGSQQFAISVDQTEGVVDCPAITPLPGAPNEIIGVGSVRGRMTIVVDLSVDNHQVEKRRLILIKGESQMGLAASRVDGVITLTEAKSNSKVRKNIAKADPVNCVWPLSAHFVRGKSLVPIIEADRLSELW
jgi:chemotaxis signal transduction protein